MIKKKATLTADDAYAENEGQAQFSKKKKKKKEIYFQDFNDHTKTTVRTKHVPCIHLHFLCQHTV